LPLAANQDIGLRTAVVVNGEYNAVSVVLRMAARRAVYDMQAIYETGAKKGGGRLG
jgi:hypothetical protein